MFRVVNAHLQEDTIVYTQHMVLSLSTRVRGGPSVHSGTIYCMCTIVSSWRWALKARNM